MRSEPEGRIMFFQAYPHHYAGAQRVTHTLAGALPERGYQVRVVAPADGPFISRLRADAIDAQHVDAPAVWARYGRTLEGPLALPALAALPGYWLKLSRAIRSWRPWLVHCNDHRGLLLAGPAARLARTPVIWHVHGAYPSMAINILGGILAARVLVVSRALLAEMPVLRRFGGKVEVLHNGLPRSWPADPPAAVALPQAGRRTVVCTARIHPEKGLDVLIGAAVGLREEFPDLQVQIVGGVQPGYEQYGRELELLRASLGLQEAVHFLGYLEDPGPILAGATVYVQPSRAEPFGLGVLEAMWLGVPVVTSRVGGLLEIVEDGVSGLQVQADDPLALAAVLRRVLTDPAYAQKLGAAGRLMVETTFSQDAMLARLLQIYREVVQRG